MREVPLYAQREGDRVGSYRVTFLMIKTPLEGPASRTMGWSYGGGLFLMSEVPLQEAASSY
jgi:hypothetical protein